MALPLLGGAFAVIWPDVWKALVLGAVLVLAGTGMMILAGFGLLYLPSLALLGYAALDSKRHARARSVG